MDKKITITALVVTHNAERFIRTCLESVKWADEIVLVDMFSSDRTVQIAKEYTQKIYLEKELVHEKRANIGIDRSTSDWILKVNATEAITEALKDEILKTINKSGKFAGYYVPRLNYFWGRLIPEYPGTLYLFKREAAGRYTGNRLHEAIAVNGRIGFLRQYKIHWGNHITIEEGVEKTNRYTSQDSKSVFSGQHDAFFWKRPVYKANIFNMVYRTLAGFFSSYILGKGYRYGMHGFILAVHHAFNFFLEIAKLYELQYKQEHHIDDSAIPPSFEEEERFVKQLSQKR
jgi:glycosyltransferase involved in cell wall biosynthesis